MEPNNLFLLLFVCFISPERSYQSQHPILILELKINITNNYTTNSKAVLIEWTLKRSIVFMLGKNHQKKLFNFIHKGFAKIKLKEPFQAE